ncbi:MAG: serine/threonine protein kinase [Myxococcales bacterium]|nr:serine/threonine protein kinase [Myxococcales bacterium]
MPDSDSFVRRDVGQYSLVSLLGEGGAANTYLAIDSTNGARLAVKELRLLKSNNSKQIELFERECATLRELDHPQIPRFIDNVVERRAETISLYLVQELIEGQSLQQLIDGGAKFDSRTVVEIMQSCLDPLAYLHERTPPLFHRDIKPSNIIRRPDGSCVLVDFGAVREAVLDNKTGGSSVVGTFGYMAPEQFQARAYPATDLYGLAATALHLLTGTEPGRFPLRRLKPDIHSALATDAHLTAILDILLEPVVEDRYSSAKSLQAALERWTAAQPPAPAPPPAALPADPAPEPVAVAAAPLPVVSPVTPVPDVGPEAEIAAALASVPYAASAFAAVQPSAEPAAAHESDTSEYTAPRLSAADLPPIEIPREPAIPPDRAHADDHQQLAERGGGTRALVVTERAPLLEAFAPTGQGGREGGTIIAVAGALVAAYGVLGNLEYNGHLVAAIGAVIAAYGLLTVFAPRRAAGRTSPAASRGETVDAEVSRIVRRVGPFGGAEWIVEYHYVGPDELHYSNRSRLPSANAARDIAVDPARLGVRYDRGDASATVVVLRK